MDTCTCQPWAVAAVYLMQSTKGREHYTDIVKYVLNTKLTEFVEKGVATSHAITEMLNQKVINNRAVFITDGNGYYSLDNVAATLKETRVQDVIQSLKDNNQEVNLVIQKDEPNGPGEDEQVLNGDDETLSNDIIKLSKVTKKLSDDAKRLSDETIKLSDETIRLGDENKKLRQTLSVLNKENEHLKEKLQSIKQLCEC